MAVILQAIYNVYQEYIIDKADERVANLPLLRSVWTVPLITGAYLYFVLRCGPKWMSCRKPVQIRGLLIVYNLAQVVANVVAFSFGLKYLRDFSYSFFCQPLQLDGSEQFLTEMKLGYIYFLLKVLDLSDTVFFVLRKKQSHVSFLHVYHHTVMVLASAFFLRYFCGGHAFVLGLLNTFVHAVMYGYFFLSIYWPEVTKGASWKRYITQIQMAQFTYLVFHFFRPIILGVECGYPRTIMWFVGTQNVFMMLMFGDFYWRTYVKKPRAHHKRT